VVVCPCLFAVLAQASFCTVHIVGLAAELVRFQEYLDDYTRADIARTLETISQRALDYARQFGGSSTRALTAKRS
jgi:hypothetical protein